ncbi:hypothetical protein PH210_06635 [Paenibacillus sp. BSR1-1]|uniref:hypothetical protein n=1 Tax=Paenibacillus sp. BSR1-1 TaxID=3020845 RepID=UPI0025B106BA|nr:hypothetical protein [Paenibacillus sp. BSR1-1]MDN3015883.1 hypothetical protein [Paenibacillus sp. BSR1-1]
MGKKENNCEVRSHNAVIVFAQQSASSDSPNPVTYFEDHTDNHYKALINVRISGITPGPIGSERVLQLVVQPRHGHREINIDIPIFPFSIGPEPVTIGQVVAQIEDAESVSIRWEVRVNGSLDPIGIISGTIDIQKDFCICCP